ncbi:MAG TPA: prepilin-type N-terminal cleavage/methylation domain-containing protein [Thermoleophilaceae bacterium]|nr:prepilin-type N-terminal cleavage/methylation domain-containing protein [Thermoleophilaceae bacterium]
MLTRARSESGFTLIELLVAISLGMVVIIALLTLIDSSGSARARLTDKTETVQRMRIGMDRIVRVLRTQVCASTTAPPLISGDASAVTFYSDTSTTGGNGSFRPRKVALYYSSAAGGSVVQDTYLPTNTSSPWTYDAAPTTKRTLIDHIAGAAGGSSIFKYYSFEDLDNPIPGTDLPLDTTLASSTVAPNSVAKVTKIDVGLTARPQSGNQGAGRSTTLTNTVLTRNSDFSGGDNIGRSWGPRCG